MEQETFIITIDGQEVSDLYEDIVRLEVELDDELAAMFQLTIAIAQENDGTWAYLDDENLQVWKPVKIEAGLGGVAEEIISGYITHVKPSFDPDVSQCTLKIWGMDGSVLMDREEKLKAWPNKKDSDIATEIFRQHEFTPEVENTEIVHDEKISTIIQHETDIQFLRRLARRNGFECYVEGFIGYFQPSQIPSETQPAIAIHFGDDTTVQGFSLEVNALTPANVGMFQIDRTNKKILSVAIEDSEQIALGKQDADRLLPSKLKPGRVFSNDVTTGHPEMLALCHGLYEQGSWFITGEGAIDANSYGHVLKPRQTVTIKGIGETYSGVYYLTHVTHSFTPDGYIQSFKVKRNALLPTGQEVFSAPDQPLSRML